MPQVVASVTQATRDPGTRRQFRSGCTIVMDLISREVTYSIGKGVTKPERRERTASFLDEAARDPLRKLMIGIDHPEPFALTHALLEDLQ